MSRKRKPRSVNNQVVTNKLTDVAVTLAGINGGTGGSFLSSYNTWGFSNNYSLITLNRIILTYQFAGNGIFQTAIQLPIQDGIGKGIEIESGELDNTDIQKVLDYWEEKGIWNSILNYLTWVRLFGGGALLINTNQDPEKPLNLKNLSKTPIELYDLDRWQLDTNISYFDDWDSFATAGNNNGLIYLYGEPIHESRFIRGQGKRAPHYIRRQLRGWGMSEGERMIRDLNLYLKTQDATFELIDEAKVDIYKINGLAQKLLTTGGTSAITQRIQTANEIKNYVNALVLDANEEYEQKTMTFAGLAEIMQQNRMGVAAALRMPMTKLFGLSASGLNNSGESDLENYNSMVESEIRAPLRPVIRKLLNITMSHLFGFIPEFTFKFPSLREMTQETEQKVKDAETNRVLSLYDRGLIDSEETMQSLKKADVIQIETKAEQGLVPNPEPPNGPESVGGEYDKTPALGSSMPDGTGPHGRGLGPGKGKADGTGLKNAGEFEESKHPRDKGGKFGSGGGGEVKKKDEKESGSNLAPNGEPSKLNKVQYKQARSKEFKNWFGDWENDPENASKVLDSNGEPLVLYHGSGNSDIESFSSSKIFFTDDKNFAEELAERGNEYDNKVYKTYLNMKNPANLINDKLTDNDISKLNDQLEEYYQEEMKEYYDNDLEELLDDLYSGILWQSTSKEFQYDILGEIKRIKNADGIIFRDAGFSENDISWVVFDSKQIKSATENSGSFDPKSKKIKNKIKNAFKRKKK